MTRWLAWVLVCAVAVAADGGYRVLRKLELGGDGHWDYVTFDPAQQRLFLAHGTHVIVVDAGSGKVAGDIPDTAGVHGIALAPELGRGFTSNGKSDTATIFDLATLKPIGTVPTGGDPDAILYETSTKRVFTFNGHGHDATVLDAATGQVLGAVALAGRPEFAVEDGTGRVFVDLIDRSEVVAFDARALAVLARFPTAPCAQPSGLAIDAPNHRLFVTCRNRQMVVLDDRSGRVIAALPIGAGVDGAAFDAARRLAFASNADGTLTVVREDDPDTFTPVASVRTEPGARTLALDPKTHLLYLPTGADGRFRVLVVGTDSGL